jgi:hypothetical protein
MSIPFAQGVGYRLGELKSVRQSERAADSRLSSDCPIVTGGWHRACFGAPNFQIRMFQGREVEGRTEPWSPSRCGAVI